MADRDPYELPPGQLRERFDRLVVPYVFAGRRPSDRPIAILTGAQPAAGKSQAMASVRQQNADRDVIQLSGDELRQFHPDFLDLMDTNPIGMVPATQQASTAWMQMSFAYAVEHGYSFAEGTFRNTDAVLADARFFATGRRGEQLAAPLPEGRPRHEVWVLALAVRAERSRLDALYRYLAPGAEPGRWVWPEWAQASYDTIPTTVAAAEMSPHVHRVIVTNRTGADLYVNVRQADGTLLRPPTAVEAIHAERARPLPVAEADGWLARQQDVVLQFVATDQVTATTHEGLAIALADAPTIISMSSSAGGQRLLDAQAIQSGLSQVLQWAHEGPHLQRPVFLVPDSVLLARLLRPGGHTDPRATELRTELDRRAALNPTVRATEDAIRTSAQALAERRRGGLNPNNQVDVTAAPSHATRSPVQASFSKPLKPSPPRRGSGPPPRPGTPPPGPRIGRGPKGI
ncbi:Zeta toxin [Frankia sp. EI5c]|uniref:zeta toxin family protein n=1 Tax=Frankia sp. EI5c TaxID=683316 RepID=UPI0007C36B05|nr:zeta toxin family protein [Frankia sp. EI5c]OAA27740.1 Zeta toxin [Frankia sp. EI5c]